MTHGGIFYDHASTNASSRLSTTQSKVLPFERRFVNKKEMIKRVDAILAKEQKRPHSQRQLRKLQNRENILMLADLVTR